MRTVRLIDHKGEPAIVVTESLYPPGFRRKKRNIKKRTYKSRRVNRLIRKVKK